ncbi:MAG: chorismate mutase [Firmicutes bacterium]|nr:chorismate mutase [Bacillota bacterium]
MRLRGARGAIVVKENSSEAIIEGTKELLNKMISENHIDIGDIGAIIFSSTPDLDAAFPAAGARELGLSLVPLFCCSEIDVTGSLDRCIRILILFSSDKRLDEIKHVYLGEAENLRPDLAQYSNDPEQPD